MCRNFHKTQAACDAEACSAELVEWTAWTQSDSLPTAGCYYLTCDVTISEATQVTEELILDLNGFTVTREIPNPASRTVYEVAEGGSLYLWSTKGVTGSVTAVASTVSGAYGLLTNSGTMVLDNVTVDASAITNNTYTGANSGAVTSEGRLTVNNAVILGYRHTDGFGTAIGTWGGSKTEINGTGTVIIGGNATNTKSGMGEGGVIGANGSWVINDGTFRVYKEKGFYKSMAASKHGGLIMINNAGEMTINGGTFYGHTVTANGGCINYGSRSLVINGGTFYAAKATQGGILRGSGDLLITGGTFIGTGADSSLVSGSGGLVFSNGLDATILGGTFKNGNDSNGGPNIYYCGEGVLTIGGEAVIGGEVLVIGTDKAKANLLLRDKPVVDYTQGEFSKNRNIRLKYADAYVDTLTGAPVVQTDATLGSYSLQYACNGQVSGLVSGTASVQAGHVFESDTCKYCGTEPSVIDSGACGDNLTWTLDEAGKLIISGTGPMWGYSVMGAPWQASVKKAVIENGVTAIGSGAFYYCKNLIDVTISDSVLSVGSEAFQGCDSLIGMMIPDSVTTIGSRAFNGCDSLTSVVIGKGVTMIGMEAFSGCDSLTSVTIGNNVAEIQECAFYGCDSLTDVYYDGTKAQWDAIYFGGWNDCLQNAEIHFVGDMDGNGEQSSDDALYLLMHIMFGGEDYPVDTGYAPDFDGNGKVDADDAIYLLLHALFGAQYYPISL